MEIKIKPLTKETYAKFGTVIVKPDGPADFNTDTIHSWNHVAQLDIPNPYAGLLVLDKQDIVFTSMERHKNTMELFNPMDGEGVLLMAPEGDKIDPDSIEAFYVDSTVSFTINKGVWHCPPFPLGDSIKLTLVFPYEIIDDKEDQEIEPVTVQV